MQEWEWHHVKTYFRKIINSFAIGLMWISTAMTAGLYYKLAFITDGLHWQHVVFYSLLLLSFLLLLRYYYKIWKG